MLSSLRLCSTLTRRINYQLVKPYEPVISPSSFKYDTGEKFDYYAKLESLREYALIRQDEYVVGTQTRTEVGGPWQIVFAHEREHTAVLPTLDIGLPVAELYHGIRFDWEDEGEVLAKA